jgi:hypothetical protein
LNTWIFVVDESAIKATSIMKFWDRDRVCESHSAFNSRKRGTGEKKLAKVDSFQNCEAFDKTPFSFRHFAGFFLEHSISPVDLHYSTKPVKMRELLWVFTYVCGSNNYLFLTSFLYLVLILARLRLVCCCFFLRAFSF